MHAILTVFAKEFRENLRERRTLFTALILGPLLGPLLFAGALSLQIERSTGRADRPMELALAHGERAPNLAAFLTESGLHVQPVDFDAAAARARHPGAPPGARAGGECRLRHPPWPTAARQPLALYADSSDVGTAADTEHVRAVLEQYGNVVARLRVIARGNDPLLLEPLAVPGHRCLDPCRALGRGAGDLELPHHPHHAHGRDVSGNRCHRG